MLDLMDKESKERIRVYFDCEEALRLALKQEALDKDVTVSALIEQILKRELAAALARAKKKIEERKK